jgi:hypothetical protein
MKKTTSKILIGLIALITIGLNSCSDKKQNRDEIVKRNAEEYLKANMNDPKSYEFVNLVLIDSIFYSDNIQYRKEVFSKYIEDDKDELNRIESYKIDLPSMYDENEIDELKVKISKNEKILLKIDSLENKLGNKKNEVASYTYVFSFRGNNALGAKVLNEYILQTTPSPDFKVINMTDDKDKVYLNPNDFPGYREMIEKNL